MNKKERGKRDSVFSWNDQSPNVRLITWETGKKLNVRMFEKKWTTVKSLMIPRSRGKKIQSNQSRYARHLRYTMNLITPDDTAKEEEDEEKRQKARKLTLERFKKVATKVILLRSVFIHVLKYAMEKGGHEKITSDPRLRLKVDHAALRSGKDKLFDPERFKTDYQGYFPNWAKEISCKAPGDRTDQEVDSLNQILKQLKEFRRYTPEIQRLMCRVVKYDRFGRHRVIIRKGHVGRRFYIIYSGIVRYTLSVDDCEVFSKPTEYHQLGKGDAFGELALIRNVVRSATIVCLQTTEFLYIEKEDFTEMGIDNILRKEMEIRVEFLREFDLFSTWPHDVLQKVAEESRSMEYRNDSVIDNNLLQSDMLYAVIKGSCQVLRLLDLTQRKKYIRLRRSQKTLFHTEFPEANSTSYSRQGAYSRPSALSNTTGHESRIPRPFSHPQPTLTTELVQPRLVKSEHCCVTRRQENSGKLLKRASYPCSSYDRNCYSKMESEQTKVGVGVFLSVDVIEKGQSAGLQGVLQTDENKFESNIDRRRLSLISKGCFLIIIPVETVKKHADYKTIKKIQKHAKTYPSDEALTECYLEMTKWNAYKEVLMGRIINDIERRKHEKKPGSMIPGAGPDKQEQTYAHFVSRAATRQTANGRSQTRNSYSSPITEKRQLCLPSSTISRANHDVGGDYPYKHPETIYAKGSRRNLVIMNGRIRVNAIQEKVEEQILSSCAPVY